MKTIGSANQIQRFSTRLKKQGLSIGFVPTMGALHEGHLSLIRRARRENDCVVVSIFVNPIQFNQKSDFEKYPRPARQDARLASHAGADVLFVPRAQDLYPSNFQTYVEVTHVSKRWEGEHRPGHFRGVATVVAKLFNLVQPSRAYFGEKDAQQARLIEQMVRDLGFPVKVVITPTVREKTGLAMSSRNKRLSPTEKEDALVLFRALQAGRRLIECGEHRRKLVEKKMRDSFREVPRTKVEYVAAVDPETFEPQDPLRNRVRLLVACQVGGVRLIDTLLVNKPRVHRKG